MSAQRVWFERRFQLGVPPEERPELMERLRGTPDRLRERVSIRPESALVARWEDSWSIQENAGHLVDLEKLWIDRFGDLQHGRPELRAADLENRATWAADYNSQAMSEILETFREGRRRLVHHVESLDAADLSVTSLHPRLRKPMTVLDLCFFIAEHDDHHLARITTLRRFLKGGRLE